MIGLSPDTEQTKAGSENGQKLSDKELGGGNAFIPSIWRQVKHQGWTIRARCRRYLSATLFPFLSLIFHRLLPDLFRPEMAQRA